MRIGDRLLNDGLITKEQLLIALKEQKRTGDKIGEILEELSFIPHGTVAGILSGDLNTAKVDLNKITPNEDAVALLPLEISQKYRAVPLEIKDGRFIVAMENSLNVIALDDISSYVKMGVDIVTARDDEIDNAINNAYSRNVSIDFIIDLLLEKAKKDNDNKNIEEDEEIESSIKILVEKIIFYGIKHLVTDIHFVPEDKFFLVRMRIDGVMTNKFFIPKSLQDSVSARVKVASNLNLGGIKPQDGRITIQYFSSQKIDIRVSTLPTNYGDSIVMRILNNSVENFNFLKLGVNGDMLEKMISQKDKSAGLVLVAGPTGSGKTTTLYTFLKESDTLSKSAFTLEDPIEYQFPMVRQVAIDEKRGLNFDRGLRSILRQDPDIIMVGEVRDSETAKLAINASLTGHLVFSTIHTNEAILTLHRLEDMGVESYLILAALKTVIAQRLLRRLCSHCKVEVTDIEACFNKYNLRDIDFEQYTSSTIYKHLPDGCNECYHSGFAGRIGIYEMLELNSLFLDEITDFKDIKKMKSVAKECGMIPLFDDGMRKVIDGITSVGEVVGSTRF